MKSPAVVFDLGKVLLDFDYGITVRKIELRCRTVGGELLKLIDQSPLLHRFESGHLDTAAFFREIQQLTGFAGARTEFCDAFAEIFTPIPAMVELHEGLRRRGVPTYIFSNTNELAIRHVRERFPFFSRFTDYILSYEHGAMKPEARLYEVVEQTTGRSGTQLIYIDDRPENVATGAARGWHSVLHQDPKRTVRELARLGMVSDLQTQPRSGS
jgi:HAD superfamily hydrolase (TIGR01509 family)